jgi:SAM-dependent methyltransferase
MTQPAIDDAFNAFYYRHCVGGDAYVRDRSWLAFNAAIADRIVSEIGPRRVLDAGCGFGFLVEALRARGVEADGMDVSAYAVQNVHASVRDRCWQGSLADDLPRTFDLIVSIEVLEHIPAADAERVVGNICAHAGDVLFSSTPFDRKELTHVNVQPPEYWAEQFARHGFFRDVDFDASFVTPWAVRFRKRSEPVHRIVRDYERRFAALEIERNEIRKRAFEIQTQLARARAPLPAKAWSLARRAGGRLLRLLGR